MKATIQKSILAVNYTIVVVICLLLVTSPQLPFLERAIFGFVSIFAGMGVRRVVKMLMPLSEDRSEKTDA
jgi:xanthosine utilization system XapX-like protein